MVKEIAIKISAALLAVFIMAVSIKSPVEAKHQGLSEFYYKRNSDKKIALTFDDGPHPYYTPKILDILDRYEIKATFFIIGENVKNYGGVLSEIVSRGHELGNHTFSHQNIKNKTADDVVRELEECRNVIYSECGEKTKLFRPPGGIMADICISQTDLLAEYDIIYWSIDTHDWAHETPRNIANNVIKSIRSGDIILMHDYIGKKSPTPAALELMIPELLRMGYEFVTVSELISG